MSKDASKQEAPEGAYAVNDYIFKLESFHRRGEVRLRGPERRKGHERRAAMTFVEEDRRSGSERRSGRDRRESASSTAAKQTPDAPRPAPASDLPPHPPGLLSRLGGLVSKKPSKASGDGHT